MPLLYSFDVVAPASTPVAVGRYWIDTVARKMYVAVGTAAPSDWLELGDVTATPRFDLILLLNTTDGLYYEVTVETPPGGGAPAVIVTDTPGVA